MANIMVRWLVTSIAAMLHPFYVSVIDINHNTKEKSVEISVRIFTEDLEAALRKYGNTKVDLAHPADKAAMDKLLNSYIQGKLHLNLNGKPAAMHYIGYEQRLESIWAYLEVENIPAVKKVDVNCNLLYEFDPKQTNIFHTKVNGTEKSYKLDNPKTSTAFDF